MKKINVDVFIVFYSALNVDEFCGQKRGSRDSQIKNRTSSSPVAAQNTFIR